MPKPPWRIIYTLDGATLRRKPKVKPSPVRAWNTVIPLPGTRRKEVETLGEYFERKEKL